jgi:UPF0716 protein FxsA
LDAPAADCPAGGLVLDMWLLVFFVTPIVEMYLLIEVGGYIGTLPTVLLVMITAVIGVALLRIQGVQTLTRGMARLQGGELPAQEVVEGLLLAVAGALLLTPGFVTDSFGFVLLTPVLRSIVAQQVLSRVQIVPPPMGGGMGGGASQSGPQGPLGERVIEGEYEPVDPPVEQNSDPDSR